MTITLSPQKKGRIRTKLAKELGIDRYDVFISDNGEIEKVIVRNKIIDLSKFEFLKHVSFFVANTVVLNETLVKLPKYVEIIVVNVEGNRKINKIDLGKGLYYLRELEISNANIKTLKDIEGIFGAIRLETLTLKSCNLKNLKEIDFFPVLRKLDISSNDIKSLKELIPCEKLEELNFNSNNIYLKEEMKNLKKIPNLKKINFWRNYISSEGRRRTEKYGIFTLKETEDYLNNLKSFEELSDEEKEYISNKELISELYKRLYGPKGSYDATLKKKYEELVNRNRYLKRVVFD